MPRLSAAISARPIRAMIPMVLRWLMFRLYETTKRAKGASVFFVIFKAVS